MNETSTTLVDETISNRQTSHGSFPRRAILCDTLIRCIEGQGADLESVHRQAVRMICDKLSRIACGDPDEPDHWHDIQGYARLAECFVRERTSDVVRAC